MSDQPTQDPQSQDPKVADNPKSTGGPEELEKALEQPDYDTSRRAPSTTSRRLSREEFPDAGAGQG
jgi:hypothetical protein